MPITNEECFDMLAVYFECYQNAEIAARVYRLRYPERRSYHKRVFTRLARRLRANGPIYRRQRTGRTEQNVINVLAYIQFNPNVSIRTLVTELGIAHGTVENILKEHRMHPYHMVLHQALTQNDYDKRLDFCHWLNNMMREDPNLLSKILWTDEATFGSDGGVNIHNMHYWSPENPHWMREVQYQGRWSVNVWCGIVGDKIIGPFIFDETLNGRTYLNFLQNQLPLLLEDVDLETRGNMFFQHDGCPAHFAVNVRQFLDIEFPDKWIGRGSLFFWPPRSPDLTCLDFYLWGRLKDLVFATRTTTRQDLINRINNAIQSIGRAEVETAVLSTRERLQLCIDNDGRHFEHLGRH